MYRLLNKFHCGIHGRKPEGKALEVVLCFPNVCKSVLRTRKISRPRSLKNKNEITSWNVNLNLLRHKQIQNTKPLGAMEKHGTFANQTLSTLYIHSTS